MRNEPIWIALFSVIFRLRSSIFPHLFLFFFFFSLVLSFRKFQFFEATKLTFYVKMYWLKRCYWNFMTCDIQLMNTMIFMRCMHLNNERRMIIAFDYMYGIKELTKFRFKTHSLKFIQQLRTPLLLSKMHIMESSPASTSKNHLCYNFPLKKE